MASSAVNHLVGIITFSLQKEASLLLGVHDELDALRAELLSMKSFLRDADTTQLISQGEYTWVSDLRDLAYQCEDIIDHFLYNLLHRERLRHLHSIVYIPNYLRKNYQIAKRLQNVKKKIKALHQRNLEYNIKPREGSNDTHNMLSSQRRAALFIKEDDIVGLKNESEEIEKWLTSQGEFQRAIISVVGMGGSGKTTLVAKMYKTEALRCCFDCYGWITVSQIYKIHDLLKSLINEFHKSRKESVPDLTSMDFETLVGMIINYLKEKRYLVVLDDVWDTNVWDVMSVAFPENNVGSRVIITTRNMNVGSYSPGVENQTLQMEPLNKTEAWELFCRRTFIGKSNQSCPKELHPMALELVEKCEGLPLALITMGGMMSSKRSVVEWADVYKNLNWQLHNNVMLEPVTHILLLSYIDLPYPLKHCFLYCVLFPEDYKIKRKRLIRLWIAEGFIQPDSRASPIQVAESYLMELIYRGMLQVVERNEFGRPRTCKMHDLFRELAISISDKENFCTVHDGRMRTERCPAIRRISIQKDEGDFESYEGMPHTRSLLVFADISKSTISTLFSEKLKFLRILDLEDAPIDNLPNGIGNLFNLRYLNLRGTNIAELPTSIKKLYYLETLDMRDTLIKELPKDIEELKNLRHLIMFRYNDGDTSDFQYVNGTRALFQINKLKKLEVMSFIEVEREAIKQLEMMTQLTRMGVSNLKQTDEKDLCSSVEKLKKLQYLFLMASNKEECLPVKELQMPPPYLRLLILAGKLERVPQWFSLLNSLTHLFLHWSRMVQDPLPHIAELPNLGRLDLSYAYIGQELHFSKGFTKLRELYLFNFFEVTVISIGEEVMRDVRVMHLYTCTSLTALPRGIEFLTKLETLTLPVSLRKERAKVQHVPNVKMY